MRSLLVAGALAAVALCAAPAAAQDVAAAKALFNKGLAEMEAGQFETGCPAIAESYRLDPRPGTLFTLAECEAKRGRLATAVARYDDYLAMFGRLTPEQQKKQLGRESIAAAQKAALGPLVPELTIDVPKDAPNGTVVKRGDTSLAAASFGVALPVDPGEHVITAQAPGAAPSEVRVTIAKGEKKRVVVSLGAPAATPPEPPKPAADPITPPPAKPPAEAPAPAPSGGSAQRTAAFVVGGVGVAGVAVGAVMGGLMFAKKGTVSANCVDTAPGEAVCNGTGKAAADAGKTFGLISTIAFAAGIAGVGTAAVLFATAPAKRPKAAWVRAGVLSAGPEGAAIGVRGAF